MTTLAQAVFWQQGLIDSIKDGGTWAVPRSGTLYTIHHGIKTAVCSVGFVREPSIQRVFEAMGWRVMEKGQYEDAL